MTSDRLLLDVCRVHIYKNLNKTFRMHPQKGATGQGRGYFNVAKKGTTEPGIHVTEPELIELYAASAVTDVATKVRMTSVNRYPAAPPRLDINFHDVVTNSNFAKEVDVKRMSLLANGLSPSLLNKLATLGIHLPKTFEPDKVLRIRSDDRSLSNMGVTSGDQTPSLTLSTYEPTADLGDLERRTREIQQLLPENPPPGQEQPARDSETSNQFRRDPWVRAWILINARGTCEACNKPAPFINCHGEPYLEVHHVIRLAENGSDRISNTVALCPACHRQSHYGQDRRELVECLYRNIGRLMREPASEQHHLRVTAPGE